MLFTDILATTEGSSEGIDVFAAGVGALGIIAIIVGLILLVLTITFAIRGITPLAVLCGYALLVLFIGPVWGLIIAIILLIILAIMGNMPMIGPIFGGWLIGSAIVIVTALLLAALGIATSSI